MENLKFYRCPVCGNIVIHLEKSGVPVHCCGRPMEEIIPGTVNASREKHVPVIDVFETAVLVSVGEEPHPMLVEHHIEWIAFQSATGFQVHYLRPDEPPCYEFQVQEGVKAVAAFAYCNLHGLWKANID